MTQGPGPGDPRYGDGPPPYGGYGSGGGGYAGYGPYSGYGGYGPYGGYGKPAAPKPGLVPLRPLTAGEILDGAFTAIRWNPKTILTSSAVVGGFSGVLLALATFFLNRDIDGSINVSVTGGTITAAEVRNLAIAVFAFLGVTAVVTFLASTTLTGLLTVAIGQGVLGRKETLGGAWRATRPRIGALFATVLLAGGCLMSGWLLAVGLAVGAGVLLGAGAHQPAAGVLVGLLGGGAATVLAVIVYVRWTVAIPVVMLERAGPLTGLRRSWGLVRNSSWRVLGIVLVTGLIVGTADALIKLPFGLAGGASSFFAPDAHVSAAGVIVSAVGGIVASTVTAPMLAGVVVLLYTDLRMRRERLDIALQAAVAREDLCGVSDCKCRACGRYPGHGSVCCPRRSCTGRDILRAGHASGLRMEHAAVRQLCAALPPADPG